MSSHPYKSLPEYTRWSKAVASVPYSVVDPALTFPFRVKPEDRVATAGSCFAQHIARHLKSHGFNYYVPEGEHPMLGIIPKIAEDFNYGTFSARYGNIYTSRQLIQLLHRAFGRIKPVDEAWQDDKGNWLDPFRPAIQPGGFPTLEELQADRQQHLKAVRHMFETLDVFVFTLGLTELWYSRADGMALPVCPGVVGGVYDEAVYGFKNLTINEVVADLNEFVEALKTINPTARIILTVSPVPLAATAENKHVLVSTTYSKSVLRVAAETMCQNYDHIAYFPSYEIITGNFNRGRYYTQNLRDITEEGVEHVMRLFLTHAAETNAPPAPVNTVQDDGSAFYSQMQSAIDTVCEEALIEAFVNNENAEA